MFLRVEFRCINRLRIQIKGRCHFGVPQQNPESFLRPFPGSPGMSQEKDGNCERRTADLLQDGFLPLPLRDESWGPSSCSRSSEFCPCSLKVENYQSSGFECVVPFCQQRSSSANNSPSGTGAAEPSVFVWGIWSLPSETHRK